MAEKITKAMNDGAARANAVEVLGLGQYAKVSNTEYALTVKDLEGNDKVVVVKLTVTKAQRAAEAEAKKAAKAAKATKAAKVADTDEVEF